MRAFARILIGVVVGIGVFAAFVRTLGGLVQASLIPFWLLPLIDRAVNNVFDLAFLWLLWLACSKRHRQSQEAMWADLWRHKARAPESERP